MTTSLASYANTGVSLTSLPRTEPIDDSQTSLAAVALRLDTGSRCWSNRAKLLEFNPLTHVKTVEGLPNDSVNEPTVINVHSDHQPSYLLALQIPTTAAARTS